MIRSSSGELDTAASQMNSSQDPQRESGMSQMNRRGTTHPRDCKAYRGACYSVAGSPRGQNHPRGPRDRTTSAYLQFPFL
jgi:hypothetical protein